MSRCQECGHYHNKKNGYSNEKAKFCCNACKQKAYRKRKKRDFIIKRNI